jgi:hypothetical protein
MSDPVLFVDTSESNVTVTGNLNVTDLTTLTGDTRITGDTSITGDVAVDGNLKIQGHNTKRVLIGYERFTNASGSSWSDSTSGWQDAWSVNYVRKKAGSQIYVIADVCLAQAMGANGNVSYRGMDVRLKVYDQVSDRFSDNTRDWQRIDNSFHEYQRQSRVHFPPHTLPGAQTGWTVTVVAQVSRSTGSGTRNSWGINIWNGRSFIEVFETMES